MEERYFIFEIEFLKNGSVAKAVNDRTSLDEAYSLFCQIQSSCFVNVDCKKFLLYLIDVDGNIVDHKGYEKGVNIPIKEQLISVIRSRLDDGEEINHILDTLCL